MRAKGTRFELSHHYSRPVKICALQDNEILITRMHEDRYQSAWKMNYGAQSDSGSDAFKKNLFW